MIIRKIIWKNYHRNYRYYRVNKCKNLKYFLDWNIWKIKACEVEESKIFNKQDLYYIKNNYDWKYRIWLPSNT